MFESSSILSTNKPPGNDGLTIEFHMAFWPLIGNYLVDCIKQKEGWHEIFCWKRKLGRLQTFAE